MNLMFDKEKRYIVKDIFDNKTIYFLEILKLEKYGKDKNSVIVSQVGYKRDNDYFLDYSLEGYEIILRDISDDEIIDSIGAQLLWEVIQW